MTKTTRVRYTLEFKQEAVVRLVEASHSIAAVARTLGVVEQTLHNWVKAQRLGKLSGGDSKRVSAEQMKISRLRAELARLKMERDTLGTAALPKLPKELLDQFVSGPMTGEAVDAASMAFKRALIERALGAELGHHLGYPPGTAKPEAVSNQRNGTSGKAVLTEDGPLRNDVPGDRDASFEPLLIPKHERRFTSFDDKIIAMYARGMTVGEVRGFLAEQSVWMSAPS